MHTVLPKRVLAGARGDRLTIRVSPLLLETAAVDPAAVFTRLSTSPGGLTSDQAAARLAEHGPNVLPRDERPSLARLLWRSVLNPLVLLLAVLATVSIATGDARAATMMVLMIVLSVGLKLFQEAKAGSTAAKLKAMISVHATVLRDGRPREIPLSQLVPGDVVQLAAGDMIPGDVRIVQAKDLFVIQGSLTGESFPVEKHATEVAAMAATPLEWSTIAFLGTSVEAGSASAVVVATGQDTYLGGMAVSLSQQQPQTAFDRDISRFTWLLLRFMFVMVPLVFVINGLTKGTWEQAFFFALAVAVGLTPEMLPMIVTVCLSKGAVAMSKKKVIVKRLNAIQNLGAMDVLCTDKTGTLTLDKVVLEKHCDVALHDSDSVLALAYTNSHFQTGLKNVLDRAVLAHEDTHAHARIPQLAKVDEIPFDFERRIMSVVVRTPEGRDLIISKGAPEAIFSRCGSFELDGKRLAMDHPHIIELTHEHEQLSMDGFRVLAIATKETAPREASAGATPYGKADERDLVLQGYVAFLDPPKQTCAAAIAELHGHGVMVKVITGDTPVPSLNYLLTSTCWRNDHNGFSHQGPGFMDTITSKKGTVARVYLPADANCLLSVASHCLHSHNYINLIIIDKQPQLQWLDAAEANEHCAQGASIWAWAGSQAGDDPDVILACAGDVPTLETIAAAAWLRTHAPALRLRVVNVVDLMRLFSPREHPHGMTEDAFVALFTRDTHVVFSFHGYAGAVHQLLHARPNAARFHVRGYKEEGTTTTPFDMVVLNETSRFHLAIDAIRRSRRALPNAQVLIDACLEMLARHATHLAEHLEDLPEIRNWTWSDG